MTTLSLHHNLQTPFEIEELDSGGIKVAPLVVKFSVGSWNNYNYYNEVFPALIPVPDYAVGDVFKVVSSQSGTRRFSLNRALGTEYKTPTSIPFFVDGTTRLLPSDEIECPWISDANGGIRASQRISVDDNGGSDFYLGDILPVPAYEFDPNDSSQILITSIEYKPLYAKASGSAFVPDGSFYPNSNTTAVCRLGCFSQWLITVPWNRGLVYGPYTNPRYAILEQNIVPKNFKLFVC